MPATLQRRPITEPMLRRDLTAAGVEPGTTLVVHSSLSAIGWVLGGAPAVVRALLAAVGDDGTLAMPAATPPMRGSGDLAGPGESPRCGSTRRGNTCRRSTSGRPRRRSARSRRRSVTGRARFAASIRSSRCVREDLAPRRSRAITPSPSRKAPARRSPGSTISTAGFCCSASASTAARRCISPSRWWRSAAP